MLLRGGSWPVDGSEGRFFLSLLDGPEEDSFPELRGESKRESNSEPLDGSGEVSRVESVGGFGPELTGLLFGRWM